MIPKTNNTHPGLCQRIIDKNTFLIEIKSMCQTAFEFISPISDLHFFSKPCYWPPFLPHIGFLFSPIDEIYSASDYFHYPTSFANDTRNQVLGWQNAVSCPRKPKKTGEKPAVPSFRAKRSACPERSRREAEWSRGISCCRGEEISRLASLARNDEAGFLS